MSRAAARAGSALFFVVGPGVEAGLAPWLLTGWETGDGLPGWPVLRVLGAVLALAGLAVLLHAFARFVAEGVGTPAPTAPPGQLVIGGAYRYVRNPMYVATAAIIGGQGLLLRQPVLLAAAAVYVAALGALTRLYEEPSLARRFGTQYEEYRRAVRGWMPRLRPWSP